MWVLAYYGLLCVFIAPGWLTARALHPRPVNRAFLAAAGFAYSLAVFAIPAWPALYFGWKSGMFWAVLAPWWVAWTLVAWRLSRRSRETVGPRSGTSPDVDRHTTNGAVFAESRRTSYLVAWGCLAYALQHAWLLAGELRPGLPWPALLLTTGAVVWITGLLIGLFNRHLQLDPGLRDRPAPRLWRVAAVAAVAVQMAGVAWIARPDWDDTFYLASVLRYSEGGPLNAEAPSDPGEGFPVPPHTRLLAWELLGATLCRWSGVPPMISHYTLLPPILLALVYATQWELLSRHILGRRLAPLAILGISGYWLFSVSGYDMPGSYLLTRTWQGKSVLWGLGIPLQLNALATLLDAPSRRNSCALLLAATGSLAMSSSAVFLQIVLVPAVGAACLAAERGVMKPRHAVLLALALVPPALYALSVMLSMGDYPSLNERLNIFSWRTHISWGFFFEGSGELLWLLTFPLLAAWLPGRRGHTLLFVMPLLLIATVLNPSLYEFVASHLTTHHVYYRLTWLLSVSLGLGCLTALVADSVPVVLRRPARLSGSLELAAAIAFLALLAILPGRFVWSPDNRGPFAGLAPEWGQNAYKIPRDLLPIVQRAARDDDICAGRLLAPEKLTQFFAAYTSRVSFVCSRPTHLTEGLLASGRRAEAEERLALAVGLLGSRGTEPLVMHQVRKRLLDDQTATRLLAKYRVSAIVTQSADDALQRRLVRCGYRAVMESGDYSLWKPDRDAQARLASHERQ